MSDKLVTLEHFGSAAEAYAARGELEAVGIRAAVGDDAAADMLSIMGAGLGGVKLLVFERDVERARAILEQRQAAKGPIVPSWICHECFSEVDAGFEVCWSCGATYDPQHSQLAARDAEDTAWSEGEQVRTDDDGSSGNASSPLEEGEWRCPRCGLRINDQHDHCPACGATTDDPPNPYVSGDSRSDAFRPAPASVASTADVEHLVLLAFRGAVLGLVFCPGVAHLYSLWLLIRVAMSGYELSPKANRQFYIALSIDLLFGVLLLPLTWLMTAGIFVDPLRL
ncbi:MAG: DUF2007 domain-containing protein [Pirellulaceae bacterium]